MDINSNTPQQESNWKVPFFVLWGGQALSLVGSQAVQFAIIWWLTLDSGSATVLAMAKSDAGVAPHLEGKTVRKEIVVPGKLVNIVAN